MSKDNLGKKQAIILHNCVINDERYDLVIIPHRQTIRYVRTKRQTLRKKNISKQKQVFRKRFSERRNAVSESEISAVQELHNLKESIKNHQIDNQLLFLFRTHIPMIKKRKTKFKKVIPKQTNTSIQLEPTNKTH